MPDDAQDLASHFEDVLDKEEGIAPERAPRARKDDDEDDAPEQLFPDQEVEGEEADTEDDELEDQAQPEPEDEEEAPEQAALDLNQVVAVNVDGQRAEVSLQEALNGYVRAETFHRRLNQLSQVAQGIEKDRAEIAEMRAY